MDSLISLLLGVVSTLGSIAIISLIIILHEIGHYYCAKQVGLNAEAVCVGFGRLLFERADNNRTKWQIRLWPIGGYVDLCANKKRKINQYLKLSYGKKVWIMLGGVMMNALLAIFLFWGCNSIGYEYSITQIGKVTANSLAASSGMQTNDIIDRINDKKVTTWRDVAFPIILAKATDGKLNITVKRGEKVKNLNTIDGKNIIFLPNKGVLKSLGIAPKVEAWPAIIKRVGTNSPAERAGLKPGDNIIMINNHPIEYAYELIESIKHNPDKTVVITIIRNKETIQKKITIASRGVLRSMGYIGIEIKDANKDNQRYDFIRYDFISALQQAIKESIQYIIIQAATLTLLFTGSLSIDTLGGPVVILAQTANLLSMQNLVMLLHWTAIVNISLAFINLLPIPVFDGGRILILSIEAAKGAPLSASTQERIDRYTFALLLGLCAIITYNDVARILGLIS